MAASQEPMGSSKLASYDAYFESIQTRKKLPISLQESLTAAFASVPVSSFPQVPGGQGDGTKFNSKTFFFFFSPFSFSTNS